MSLKDRLSNNVKSNKPTVKVESNPIQLKPENTEKIPNGINILDALLVDENINSIHINGAKNVFIERNGKFLKSTVAFRDNIQLTNLILNLASESGIEESKISPYMKFVYKPGIIISVTFPPVSSIPSVFIKCYHDKLADIKNFQDKGIISKELSLIFEALSLIKCNTIIAGKEGSFKTSVMSSILKLIPINNRAAIFDNYNELKSNSSVIYNLSSLDKKEYSEIVKSVLYSNPDKIIINDNKEELLPLFENAIMKGYSGIITSITADSKEEALENIIKIIMDNNRLMSYEEAKKLVYQNFNMIIFCKKDENGARKISSISEIENNEAGCIIKDVFILNKLENGEEEHVSTGVIPKLYELAKEASLPINPNIFINDYKHTYSAKANNIISKSIIKNQEILNKFKKELAKERAIPDGSNENDVIKKAQEKFEELKRNAKQHTTINSMLNDLNNTANLNDNITDENPSNIENINNSFEKPIELMTLDIADNNEQQ